MKFCLVTVNTINNLDKYLDFLHQCILGGVTCVQFRAKNLTRTELYKQAYTIKCKLDSLNTPMIINDHLDLTLDVDAAGIHIGQEDGNPDLIREQLGPNKYIGLSVESDQQVHQANLLKSIDYIAASAIFSTKNKTNCKMYWGLSGLQRLVNASLHPVIAIGGINSQNII